MVIFISGCDVNDQLYQDVPDSKVLFANDQLEQEIYLAPSVQEFNYQLFLYRSGVNNDASTSATLTVEESLLHDYNAEHGTAYTYLPENYYSFNSSVSIDSGKQNGIADVTIMAENIVNDLDGYSIYAIPFHITNADGVDVNEEKNKMILIVNLREPFVRQETFGVEEAAAIGRSNLNKMLNVYVNFDNEWDIELGYEVDLSLVESFNQEYATEYLPFPESNIVNIPSSFTITSGSSSIHVDFELSPDDLPYFEPYLLPVRLVSKGDFPIDPDRNIIYLLFTRNFDQNDAEIVSLTNDMIETFTQESVEGPKENLVDGDTSTYWHSAWSSGVEPLPHWIQINFSEEQELGGFNYTFRQPSGIGDRPNHFDVQVSNDGDEWNTVWTSHSDLPVEPVDARQTLIFDQNYSASHFRIRIIDTYASNNWTHLSTIEVFRVAD